MAVPSDFQFSQASLQDFVDCRRRFYHRYLQRLSWPALEAEPALANEQWVQQGIDFHRMVHRYLLGIPAERLSQSARGNLAAWWESFLAHLPFSMDSVLLPERMFAVELDGWRLVAKMDLVVVHPEGGVDIYDWKTSTKVPGRAYLQARLQTKVYPYVLAHSAENLGLESLKPDQIRMVYWYVGRPEQPEVFPYSLAQMEQDREALSGLIEEITGLDSAAQFPLIEDERRCRFCIYRSLCARGETAGDYEEGEIDFDTAFDLDFDRIEEIEF